MSPSDIEIRAREFAERYPGSQLNSDYLAQAWSLCPEAALLHTSVKAERIESLSKSLEPHGVGQTEVISLVAANPSCVARPPQAFFDQCMEAAHGFGQLGFGPDSLRFYLGLCHLCPALLARPAGPFIDRVRHLNQSMQNSRLPLSDLPDRLSRNALLVDILSDPLQTVMGRIRTRHVEQLESLPAKHPDRERAQSNWLNRLLFNTPSLVNEPVPAQRMSGDQDELVLMRTTNFPKGDTPSRGHCPPSGGLAQLAEQRSPVLAFQPPAERPDVGPASHAASPCPAFSVLSVTPELSRFLSRYGITHEKAVAATRDWPAAVTLTARKAKAHVREVVRYFVDDGQMSTRYLAEKYLRSLCRDPKAGFKIMGTPQGQARRYFEDLRQQTGANKADILCLLFEQPAVTANPEKASAQLKAQVALRSLPRAK